MFFIEQKWHQFPFNARTDKQKTSSYNQNIVKAIKSKEWNMIEDVILQKVMLTEDDLSEYWGIKKVTLRKWRSTGDGPIYLKIGGRVMYPRKAIKEYERTRMFRSTSDRIDNGGSDEK